MTRIHSPDFKHKNGEGIVFNLYNVL